MPTNKYWACPFCSKRFGRIDMVAHIEKKHSEELPEGFTPLRATFHAVNRKDFYYNPKCRICKQEVKWDENKGRYDQLCGSKKCHDLYVEKMKRDMGDRIGINRQTATVEGLEKMLANRKISGKYTFSDGDVVTYTGSYERKALEFFDTVLNIKAKDLMVPGPAMKYVLDGKTHIYIPDMYYIPYNLIIEIKDGGSKPNTNPTWVESRKKKLAKEEYVINHTDFNYIRLTDNDFSQIMSIFADLKMNLIENTNNKVVHVNEDATTIGAIPSVGPNDVVVVNYMQNNVFAGKNNIGISDNIRFDKLFILDDFDSTLKQVNSDFLKKCSYETYIVRDCKDYIFETLDSKINTVCENKDYLYELLFNHPQYSIDQIKFESGVVEYKDYYASLNEIYNNIEKYILGE